MILVLTAAARDGWHHLVTRDESWFFLSYCLRRMWTRTRDDVATKPRSDIHTKKSMFTVLWNPLGFHVVDNLRTGAKMESDYFTTKIHGPLEQKVFPTGRNPHAKRLTIHLDNCSIHTGRTTEEYIRQHNMTWLQHPPYSPDLAPSHFYLFPTIKEKLKGVQMPGEEDLFYRLQEILNSISSKELDKALAHGSTGS
jgi:histone-lysine N-methyltransferase SETMAR